MPVTLRRCSVAWRSLPRLTAPTMARHNRRADSCTIGLPKTESEAHIRGMAKKRGSVWHGIRDAYHLHHAMETLHALRRSGGEVFEQIGEMAMMVAVLAVICGLVWLLT